MVCRRLGPLPSEEQWRKLSLFSRSARSVGRGECHEDRLGRDYLAETERQSPKNRESSVEPIPDRQGKIGNILERAGAPPRKGVHMPRNGIHRRDFLKTLPALATVPRLRGARVKITDVRIVPLRTVKDLGSYPDWLGNPRPIRIGGGAFVEVHSDQGITGIGPDMAPTLLPADKTLLTGADPFDVDPHAERLYGIQAGTGYRGTAGVEIALWDVIGKATNQPLYKLWGGGRDRLTPYSSMLGLSTPEERADIAVKLKAQ